MASLAACLKRLGDKVDPDDAARVKELSAQYQADGMTREEAEQEAVSDVQGEVRERRVEVASEITSKGGKAPTRGEAQPAQAEEAAPTAEPEPAAEPSPQPEETQEEAAPEAKPPRLLENSPGPIYVEGYGEVQFGIYEPAMDAAKAYMKKAGLPYSELTEYSKLDTARSGRIATEFEEMKHSPRTGEVKRAYRAMIDETVAQFRAVLDTGLEIEFIRGADPYTAGPREAILDVVENNHLWVFSTRDGFGSDENFDPVDNPLLEETEFEIDGVKLLANDVFRIVHDYFGHIKYGNGFRAGGEEMAWQAHAQMYSPLARRAMTTETRGQNSWLNYGPHGDTNRTAKTEDTIFADQKIGLLPIWVSEEGRLSETTRHKNPVYERGLEGAIRADGRVELVHFSRKPVERTNPNLAGQGLDRGQRGRYLPRVTYFGIVSANENGYRKESGLGGIEGKYSLAPTSLYPADADPEGLWVPNNPEQSTNNIREAGFSGYWADNPQLGKVAAVFDPLQREDYEQEGEVNFSLKPGITSLGFYSNVEKVVNDMKLQGFEPSKKNPEGKALGKDILAKLKKSGVKKEEVEWLGLEDYLENGGGAVAEKNPRFTREQVSTFIRANGVNVKQVTAMSGGGGRVAFDWEEPFDVVSEDMWEDLKRTYIGVWHANQVKIKETGEYSVPSDVGVSAWWDYNDEMAWVKFYFDIEKYDPEEHFDVYETYNHIQRVEAIPNAQENLKFGGRNFATRADQLRHLRENMLMIPAVREDLYKTVYKPKAGDVARAKYMEDPLQQWDSKEYDLSIRGNEDAGYSYRWGRSETESFTYAGSSFNEAGVQASAEGRERGFLASPAGASEGTARWEDYVTPGRYENYREIKLTLPDTDGTYTNTVHFDDENIVTFLRVTDRDLSVPSTEVVDTTGWVFERDPGNPGQGRVLNKNEEQIWYGRAVSESLAMAAALEKVRGEGNQKHTYFIDEHQSDWHQAGRQKGYQVGADTEKLKAEVSERDREMENIITDAWEDYTGDLPVLTGDQAEEPWDHIGRNEKALVIPPSTSARVESYVAAWASHRGQMIEVILDKNLFYKVGYALAKDRVLTPSKITKRTEVVQGFKYRTVREAIEESARRGEIDLDRLKKVGAEFDKMEKELDAELKGVPNAPFKNNGWISLGLKRAVVEAVEGGYEALAFANAAVLGDRWSGQYSEMYENQYDKKMPSALKKITGIKPVNISLNTGEPIKGKVTADDIDTSEWEVRNVERLGEQVWVLRREVAGEMTPFHTNLEADIFETEQEAIEEFKNIVAKDKNYEEREDQEGYWLIEITDELRNRVSKEGLPLFARRPLGQQFRGEAAARAAEFDAPIDIEQYLEAVNDTGVTVEDVEQAIESARAGVSDKTGLNVNVIRSSEIPEAVKVKIPEGALPKGFAVGNDIFLVANHIENAADAQKVFAHEVKGHFGVENLVDDWREVQDLYAGLKERGGDKFDSILREVQARNPGIAEQLEVKEFIAIAAERREDEGSIGAFMRRVREMLKSALAKLGFRPVGMTDIDIILSRSERFLEEGSDRGTVVPFGPEFSFAREGDLPAFMTLTDKAIDRAIDKGREWDHVQGEYTKAYLSRMPIDDFLKLTTGQGLTEQGLLDEGPKTSNVEPYEDVDAERFRPDEVDQDDLYAIPFLLTDYNIDTGVAKVVAHEGRHRSAMLRRDGGDTIPVMIEMANMDEMLDIMGADSKPTDVESLQGQYDGSVIVTAPAGVNAEEENKQQIQELVGNESAPVERLLPEVEEVVEPAAEAEPEVLFSMAPRGRVGFDAPVETMTDSVIRAWQDKFRPVLKTQRKIEEAGGDIPLEKDAYLAEELFYGKTENDIRVLREDYIEPLAEGMAKNNISREELDEWLMAKHAKERNEQIAKINPDMPEGGSGMTDAEADAILAAPSNQKVAQLNELSQYIYDLLDHKRMLMRQGLQADEVTDAWEAVYENYVPLKGMADNEPATGQFGTGRGFDIRGKEGRRAMGRQSRAESPVLHAIRDVTESQIRYRKNEVGNAFLAMVEDNPNPGYWEIFTDENPDTDRRIIKTAAGEEVREVPVNMAAMKDQYFATKRDGKTYYVKIEDPRLIRALQNMGPESVGIMTRALGTVTRFLSSMSTSYNPEFMISNMARDVQTAVLNLMAEQEIPGGRAKNESLVTQTVKDIPIAMRAIHASLRGKRLEGAAEQWQASFESFREAGAKTGWFDMKEMDQQAAELNRMISVARGGVPGKLKAFADGVIEFVENANSAVENAVRLSVYRNAMEAGVPRKRAASLAKNLTVNFNRKGEIGAVLNSLYMFANASIQGTAVFLRAMGTLKQDPNAEKLPVIGKKRMTKAQQVAAGLVGFSFMLSMVNRQLGGEDDDGVDWYDKLPDHVRERNLVLMKPGTDGEYWSFPLPYGYNIFHVAGDTLESALFSSERSAAQLGTHLAMSALGSFSPIGFETSEEPAKAFAKTVTPTVLKPVVSIAVNENFYGAPIYRENLPFGTPKPDSALAKRSAKEHWKAVSSFMNEATGGSAFRSGYVDVSPDTLGYLFDFATGGAGKFASMAAGFAEKKVKGQEVEPREVPFLRKLSGQISEYNDQAKYYDRSIEIKQLDEELESLRGDERKEFLERYGEKVELAGDVKATEKELRELRKERREVETSSLPEAEKEERVERIQEKMDTLYDRFNKSYNLKEEGQ